VLEVPPNASAYEIGRAHREARTLYGEGTLASYTFFSAGERETLLKRVETAYDVLSNPSRRAAYDRELGLSTDSASGGADNLSGPSPEAALLTKIRRGVVNGDARRWLRRLTAAKVVTGHDFRQLREAIGLTVDEIENGSTVGTGLVNALENDRSSELPSWLNLRASLMDYARLLQADPEKLTEGYLKHLAAQQ